MKVEKWADYVANSLCGVIQRISRNQGTLSFLKTVASEKCLEIVVWVAFRGKYMYFFLNIFFSSLGDFFTAK